jgi:hypothetical protein
MYQKIKREPRRSRHHEAWIFFGEQWRQCVVLDLSTDGAKLALSGPEVLPKQFLLGFSKHIGKAEKCELAWRRGTTIGVKFTL